MTTRSRTFLLFAAMILATGGAFGAEEKSSTTISRGLSWLARQQTQSGAWSNAIGYKLNYSYFRTGEGAHVGVTAIAGLAFLANGHTPSKGEHAPVVKKALDFVLRCMSLETGFIGSIGKRVQGREFPKPNGSEHFTNKTGMYSHAFAGLFLAEVLAAEHFDPLMMKVEAAVRLTLSAQNKTGGWRYLSTAKDADLSVTACQLHFLYAAKRAGVAVPENALERGREYVEKCRTVETGAFHYQASRLLSRVTFALTAAGLSIVGTWGKDMDYLTRKGLDFLKRSRPVRKKPGQNDLHYFYGLFFAASVYSKAKDPALAPLWKAVREEVIKAQGKDGSWKDEIGPAYATAMACIILSATKE
jgi:hypothetical protein